MKRLVVYLMMCLISVSSFACNPKTTEAENTQLENKDDKIEVYYFHFARRCMTCNAVEAVTKEALNEYFAKEVKNGNIVFTSINLDEESSKAIAEKLKVSGQTLLFVSGDKQINLTNKGFMYAKSSPDKLKAEVKSTIAELQK